MRQANHKFSTSTRGKGLYNITREITSWVTRQKFGTGLLTIFIPHTSASIVIQENADPDVLHDLNEFFQKLVPEGEANYLHRSEGLDDMPAHIKSALTNSHLTLSVKGSNIILGTWQGLYLFEHRLKNQIRKISLVPLTEKAASRRRVSAP